MNVRYREYNEADADAVISLLKETYGENYIKQDLYDPHKLNEYNKNGLLTMTVTVDEAGQVVGVVGREKSKMFKNQFELVTQVIRKDHRGMNLSRSQLAFQVSDVLHKNENFISLYAYVLAYHTKAQRNAEHLGFISCGFLLNVYDAGIFTVTGLAARQKHSQTIVVLPRASYDAGTLYIPPGLNKIITDTYRKLNADFHTGRGTPEFTAKPSEIDVRIDETHKHISAWVYKAGIDFSRRIEDLTGVTAKPAANDLWVINLYLNMKDENAEKACGILCGKGFFFTGIHPLSGSGEFIVMHNPLRYKSAMAGVAYIESQAPFTAYIPLSKENGNEKTGY